MAKVFRFGDFELDTGAFELRRGPVVVPVEPLVLDLLTLLLEHPGVVLSRDRLVESVWKGRIVSESTISTAIKSARKALGDTGRDQKYIRTIRGRGIQFAVPVEAAGTTAAGSPSAGSRCRHAAGTLCPPFRDHGRRGSRQPCPAPCGSAPDRSWRAFRCCASRLRFPRRTS